MRHRSLTVIAALIAAVLAGVTAGWAASTPSTKVIEACYSKSDGALSLHAVVHKAQSYKCKRGHAPLSWDVSAPSASGTSVYWGSFYVNLHKRGGKSLPRAATLIAETRELPAGNYAITGFANIDLEGQGFASCFIAKVSAVPHDDGVDGQAYDADSSSDVRTVAVEDQIRDIRSADRIGLYCHVIGSGQPNSSALAIVDGADFQATLTSHLQGVRIARN
jgi:hypothetical protein